MSLNDVRRKPKLLYSPALVKQLLGSTQSAHSERNPLLLKVLTLQWMNIIALHTPYPVLSAGYP